MSGFCKSEQLGGREILATALEATDSGKSRPLNDADTLTMSQEIETQLYPIWNKQICDMYL